MAQPARIVPELLRLSAGPLIWFAYFNVLYAAHTLVCVLGARATVMHTITAVTTVLACAALAPVLLWPRGARPASRVRAARLLAFLALLAIAWTAWAAQSGTPCVAGTV
jgi:hypothetical protein